MTSRLNTSAATVVCRIMHAGSVIYPTQDFESGSTSGWSSSTTTNTGALVVAGLPGNAAKSGLYYLNLTGTAAGLRLVYRTITGLTVGRTYTFLAWTSADATQPPVAVGVTGIGASATVSPVGNSRWVPVSYTFVATATSHNFELRMTGVTSVFYSRWDDLQVFEHEYQSDSVTLTNVKSAQPKLDERRAPYATARITAAIPSLSDLAKLDPRTTVRATLSASNVIVAPAASTQTRDFDLVLHERTIDFKNAELTLVLEGDESLLIDAGNKTATTDTSAEANQSSLRSIVAAFLAKYYAGVDNTGADFDLTITYNATNLIENPSFETNTAGVPASTGTSAFARVALPSAGVAPYIGSGLWCLRATASAATSFVGFTTIAGTRFPVTVGQSYSFSFWLTSQVSRSATARLQWYDSTGAVLSFSDGTAAASPLTTSLPGWTRYTVTAIAPVGAASVEPFAYTTGNSVGNLHYIDGVMLTNGTDAPPSFDGSFTDIYYTYAWVGTAHASASTRVRLDSRDRNLLQQPPGTKDWDFLQRLVQAAGLRLFCDEARVWRLVNPTTYTVAGTIAIAAGTNLTGGTDTISKQNGTWYDAVVIKYSWIGPDGLPKVAYDPASTGVGGTLLFLEWSLAYPGPGAAAAVLARAQGRGRVQSPEALTDLTATPGMALTTSLDSTPNQVGVVSAVEWLWDAVAEASDTMTVTSRDLVDA